MFNVELCVRRVVAVLCEFSVVVSGGTARWQKLVGFVEALDGVVETRQAEKTQGMMGMRNYGKMTSLAVVNGKDELSFKWENPRKRCQQDGR